MHYFAKWRRSLYNAIQRLAHPDRPAAAVNDRWEHCNGYSTPCCLGCDFCWGKKRAGTARHGKNH